MIRLNRPFSCLVIFTFITLIVQSCGQRTDSVPSEAGDSAVVSHTAALPNARAEVKAAPIASYRVKTNNDLNDWYFSVSLFETAERHTYKMVLRYEEVKGVDQITFPNLHKEPQPEIRKGDEPYSCIVGFLDQEGKFREYKKVGVKNGQLKITTLKSYAVYAK